MEKKQQTIIRSILIFTGVSLILFALILIYKIINNLLQTNITTTTEIINIIFESFEKISEIIPLLITLIILGLIIYKLGRHWDNIFKALTKSLVGFALFFLTISIMIFPINSNADQIANSIQPSIDYLTVNTIDSILENQFKIANKPISITLSSNEEIEKILIKNITQTQANTINNIFETNFKNQDAITFAKIFITMISEELIKTDPNSINIPIPIEELKNILSQEMDINLLKTIDINLLEQNSKINEQAQITLLLSENSIKKTINPSKINKEDVNEIWKNLDLETNINYETKEKIIAGILSLSITQLETQQDINTQNFSIPITSIKYSIPNELKELLNNGILDTNISKRLSALNITRNNCGNEKQNQNTSLICEAIEMTKYENMIQSLNEIDTQELSQLGIDEDFNLTSIFENYQTTQKIDTEIKKMTNNWSKYFYIYLILIILSIITYYLHFNVFNRELIIIHIPHYISKLNLIAYIPSFIFILIIYFILKSEFIIEQITNIMGDTTSFNQNFFMNLPIYEVILKINYEFLILSTTYLFLSVLTYISLYYLLKRKLNQYEQG